MNRKKRKCIGAVMAAFGLGMLIAGFVPIWGIIAAIEMCIRDRRKCM